MDGEIQGFKLGLTLKSDKSAKTAIQWTPARSLKSKISRKRALKRFEYIFWVVQRSLVPVGFISCRISQRKCGFTVDFWEVDLWMGSRWIDRPVGECYIWCYKKKNPHLLRWFYDFPHSINVHFHHLHHVHIQSMFNYSNIIVTRFPWNHYFPNDLFHGFSHDILRSKHSEMKTLATRSDAKDKSSGTPPLPMD